MQPRVIMHGGSEMDARHDSHFLSSPSHAAREAQQRANGTATARVMQARAKLAAEVEAKAKARAEAAARRSRCATVGLLPLLQLSRS